MSQTTSNMFQMSHLKQLPPVVWSVLVGTLIVRTSYFMAWPFLVVILYRDYGATATEIGSMLAVSALVGVVTGFYSGHLSDLIGRKRIIISGCLVSALAYFGLSQASELHQFYILIVMCGLMRSMIEEPSKALISDWVDNLTRRELAMNLRYFAINVGGALGPFLGVQLAISNPEGLFTITSVTYAVYAVALLMVFHRYAEKRERCNGQHESILNVIGVIRNDSRFIRLVMANLFMMFVYAHYGSTIPQIITRSGGDNAEVIIAALILINTLTVVLFQFPLLRLMQRFSLVTRARAGVVLMAISQLMFIALPREAEYGWYAASFVLSLGEVIAFPTINVQIDRLAPARLRGAYFGAASFVSLGFAIAPIAGGMILDFLSPVWLFGSCTVMCLFTLYLYGNLQKQESNVTLVSEQ